MDFPLPTFVAFARVVRKASGLTPTQLDPDFNVNDWIYEGQSELAVADAARDFLIENGCDNTCAVPMCESLMSNYLCVSKENF